MRRLMERVADAETETSLRVIATFDRLLAEQASVAALAHRASELTGHRAGAADALNGVHVRCSPAGPLAGDGAQAAAVERAAARSRLRGRTAVSLHTDAGPVLAAAVEQATGRSGAVWLEGGEPWTLADHVTVERLAHAVSIRALEERDRRARAAHEDPAALERLLCGAVSADAAAIAARRAGLSPHAEWIALAVRERPAGVASADALLERLLDALATSGAPARGTVLRRRPVLVVAAGSAWRGAVDDAVAGLAQRGWGVTLGAGRPAPVQRLAGSLRQAREALVLGPLLSPAGVTAFEDLGILHLLAQIPRHVLTEHPDFRAVAELDGSSSGVSDLSLLEAYCEVGSLRKTAERLFLHHSSVHYRVRRLEQTLGFPLASPAERLRAMTAVRLVQIERLRAADGE